MRQKYEYEILKLHKKYYNAPFSNFSKKFLKTNNATSNKKNQKRPSHDAYECSKKKMLQLFNAKQVDQAFIDVIFGLDHYDTTNFENTKSNVKMITNKH